MLSPGLYLWWWAKTKKKQKHWNTQGVPQNQKNTRFVFSTLTSRKQGSHVSETANLQMLRTKKRRPKQFSKQPGLSSRACESSIFNMLEKKGTKFRIVKTIGKKISRRQDAPKCFDLTTVCYVFKPEYILKTKNLLSGKVGFVEIPKERAIDIDDKIDYKVVSILAK